MSGRPNDDKNNAIRVLEYWFLMELLNQQSLELYKKKGDKASKYKKELISDKNKECKKLLEDFVEFKAGDNLQTMLNSLPEQMKKFYTSDFTVFIGCMKKENCIQKIARNVQWKDLNPETKKVSNDEITLAILKFSKNGRFIPDTLALSPLAWAQMKLSDGTANASQKVSIDNYNSDSKTIEDQIINQIIASNYSF